MNRAASLPGRTFGVLHRRFFVIVVVAFWPYLVLIALFALTRLVISTLFAPQPLAGDPKELWLSLSPLSKIGLIVAFVATASLPWGVSTAGVSLIVCREERGNPLSLRDALAQLKSRWPTLLALSFILGTALTILSALFFVPGLIAFAVGYPALTASADEGLGVGRALKRGSQVALARLGTVIALAILCCLISTFVAFSLPLFMARFSELSDSALTFMIWGSIAIVPPALILLVAPIMAMLYCEVCRKLQPPPENLPSPIAVKPR